MSAKIPKIITSGIEPINSETILTDIEASPISKSPAVINEHVCRWLRSSNIAEIAQLIDKYLSSENKRKLIEQLQGKCTNNKQKKKKVNAKRKNRNNQVSPTVPTVSTVGPSFMMNHPLIVILGIGIYDGLPALPGVKKDYENIINTFVKYYQYNIFYQLDDNNPVYTNKMNQIKNNFKIKWSIDEMETFVENARKHVVQHGHNGLIFSLSCHGDTNKKIYDSKCEFLDLESLFMMFVPGANCYLGSYQETEQESNILFQIPKIFLLDHCRGDATAKVSQITATTMSNHKIKHEKKEDITIPDKSQAVKQPQDHVITSKCNTASNSKPTTSNAESFTLKTVSKEQATTLAAQMTNFCKLYANTEGFTVASGTEKGGLFLRNVCAVFSDLNFVSKHLWDEIIIKIREKTKQDATLVGELFNFTQLVENEGTLETRVQFCPNMKNVNNKNKRNKFGGPKSNKSLNLHDNCKKHGLVAPELSVSSAVPSSTRNMERMKSDTIGVQNNKYRHTLYDTKSNSMRNTSSGSSGTNENENNNNYHRDRNGGKNWNGFMLNGHQAPKFNKPVSTTQTGDNDLKSNNDANRSRQSISVCDPICRSPMYSPVGSESSNGNNSNNRYSISEATNKGTGYTHDVLEMCLSRNHSNTSHNSRAFGSSNRLSLHGLSSLNEKTKSVQSTQSTNLQASSQDSPSVATNDHFPFSRGQSLARLFSVTASGINGATSGTDIDDGNDNVQFTSENTNRRRRSKTNKTGANGTLATIPSKLQYPMSMAWMENNPPTDVVSGNNTENESPTVHVNGNNQWQKAFSRTRKKTNRDRDSQREMQRERMNDYDTSHVNTNSTSDQFLRQRSHDQNQLSNIEEEVEEASDGQQISFSNINSNSRNNLVMTPTDSSQAETFDIIGTVRKPHRRRAYNYSHYSSKT